MQHSDKINWFYTSDIKDNQEIISKFEANLSRLEGKVSTVEPQNQEFTEKATTTKYGMCI